jgi:tetratricopeptide (TPR) repeat protein
MQDYDTGIKFCKVGLISNPHDPLLLNNLAFSLAMNNKPIEVFEYLNKVDAVSEINEQTRICLLATKGLACFRSGNIEQGRNFYLQAMEYAQKKKYSYYYYMALLNLAREEAFVNPDLAKTFYERISKIDDKDDEKLKFLKNQITEQLLRYTM